MIGIETSLHQRRSGRSRMAGGIAPDCARGLHSVRTLCGRRRCPAGGRAGRPLTASSVKSAVQVHVSGPDILPGFRRVPHSDDETLPLTFHGWRRRSGRTIGPSAVLPSEPASSRHGYQADQRSQAALPRSLPFPGETDALNNQPKGGNSQVRAHRTCLRDLNPTGVDPQSGRAKASAPGRSPLANPPRSHLRPPPVERSRPELRQGSDGCADFVDSMTRRGFKGRHVFEGSTRAGGPPFEEEASLRTTLLALNGASFLRNRAVFEP
jgi:hypothetical protein